jgi:3' terminal RNA ribose 2'-O-methyltransferase Hen1
MLLTITTTAPNATDLGYLLHKNPENMHRSRLWFGEALVFYPEATADRCTAALMIEVDPVGLVRSRRAHSLDQYVNDRPYVACSLLSVAIADCFGTALAGRSKERQQRVTERMPLVARLAAIRCSTELICRLFGPLGYEVRVSRGPLDARRPEWGDSPVASLEISGDQTVHDLLSHLYVLIPVLDNAKHYYVGEDEVDKLLAHGENWLKDHPERDLIARRYLLYRREIVREAIARLDVLRDDAAGTQEEADERATAEEAEVERPLRLDDLRMEAALAAVGEMDPPAERVVDLGCGEGKLLRMLQKERSIRRIVGVDVAAHALEQAARRLKTDRIPDRDANRLSLIQGSLVYRDERFRGFDAALMIEVIEHLDPPRLQAMEQVVFAHARPRRIVLTTPNVEFNAAWPSLAGRFRHHDHRFEWSRDQFRDWVERVAGEHGYNAAVRPVGSEDPDLGPPTQMAVFDRIGNE